MPTGYTPARKKPVAPRSRMAGSGWAARNANAALAAAAAMAETTRTLIGLKTSGILKSANVIAPTENPICTAIVSHDPRAKPECHKVVTCGITAVPVNHNDIASKMETEYKKSARRDETPWRASV